MDSAKTISLDGKEHDLPDGIESHGNLYYVPISMLYVKEDENPRRLGAVDGLEGQGLDKESMKELFEWIKTQGLKNPLSCYWRIIDGVLRPQVADGERRYLCLDRLVDKDESCFCRKTNKQLPATEIYNKIPCDIEVGSKKDALTAAFMLQSTSVSWGDGAVVKIVQQLRDEGADDAEILERLKKGQQWLTETDSLLALDQETFNYLLAGKINRTLGLRYAGMKDLDRRHEYLMGAYEEAIDEYEVEESQAEEDLDKAISNQEIVESNLAEAVNNDVDEDTLEELKEEVEKAKKKTATKRVKATEVKSKKPKAGTRHLTRVAKSKKDRNRDIASRHLGKKGIQQYLASIQQLILNEGNDADGNPVQSIDALNACEACCKAILNGEEDIVKALREADTE